MLPIPLLKGIYNMKSSRRERSLCCKSKVPLVKTSQLSHTFTEEQDEEQNAEQNEEQKRRAKNEEQDKSEQREKED